MLCVIDFSPESLPFSGASQSSASGFDIVRDFPAIGLVSWGLFFGVSLIYAIMGGGQWDLRKFQFYLFHVIFVPIALFALLWTCQHSEQIQNRPEAWMYDLRLLIPAYIIFAFIDYRFIVVFMKRKREEAYGDEALRCMQAAHQLLAEGRCEEADAAYAKGRWLLDNKCKRK